MAYITQDMKRKIAARLKKELPNWSFRLKISHHSKIVVTIVKADLDLLNISNDYFKSLEDSEHNIDYAYKSGLQVYGSWSKYFGSNKEAAEKMQVMFDQINLIGDVKDENYDRSDVMVDHFDVGYYTSINIGGDTESTRFQYVPSKKKKVRKNIDIVSDDNSTTLVVL